MDPDQVLHVLIHTDYGCFRLPRAFEQSFVERYPHKAYILPRVADEPRLRADPDLASFFRECEMIDPTRFRLQKVLAVLVPYMSIRDEGGREWIEVDYNAMHRVLLDEMLRFDAISDEQMDTFRARSQYLKSLPRMQDHLCESS